MIEASEVMMIDSDWRDPFILYLQSGTLPTDSIERQRPEIKARAYVLVDGDLYQCGGPNVLMNCVSTPMGNFSSRNPQWHLRESRIG